MFGQPICGIFVQCTSFYIFQDQYERVRAAYAQLGKEIDLLKVAVGYGGHTYPSSPHTERVFDGPLRGDFATPFQSRTGQSGGPSSAAADVPGSSNYFQVPQDAAPSGRPVRVTKQSRALQSPYVQQCVSRFSSLKAAERVVVDYAFNNHLAET